MSMVRDVAEHGRRLLLGVKSEREDEILSSGAVHLLHRPNEVLDSAIISPSLSLNYKSRPMN